MNDLTRIAQGRMLCVCLLLVFICVGVAQAQIPATVNIQGVLRTSNGTAVPDGPYTVIFKLYEQLQGGTAIWDEMQDVEVTSGIYTTILGGVDSFQLEDPPVTFDRQYFLEVVLAGKALVPRIPLTPAPYALSLLGNPNTFPASGAIRADGAVFGEDLDAGTLDLAPEHSIVVKGGTLARGATGTAGSPGADGANNNGYAFTNDKESGLFSTGDNKVALYSGNTEQLLVYNDTVKVQHELEVVGNLNMSNTKSIAYNGQSDWRLVETDYLESGPEGWQVYDPIPGDVVGAWSNSTGMTASVTDFDNDFAVNALVADAQGQVFKKEFTPPESGVAGAYTYVKVVFRYFFFDTWDLANADAAWAAFSKTENAVAELSVGWSHNHGRVGSAIILEFDPSFNSRSNIFGTENVGDSWLDASMVGRYPSGTGNESFWVMFGGATDSATSDENWGVGMIEIWVK